MNARQALFVEEYLRTFNATQAALAAGYSPKTAHSIGAENLKKPEIATAISQRLTEAAMSADEVLMRLADHARGSIDDFVQVTEAGPVFNFKAAQEAGKLHLIKKLKTKTKIYVAGKGDEAIDVTEIDVEFELYDAQSALEKLGRHHKLFTDQTDVNLNGILQVVMDR